APEDRDHTAKRLVEAAQGEIQTAVKLRRIKGADGSWIWCETVSTNLLAEPSVAGTVVVLRDVSARVAAEQVAAAEHLFTSTILDTMTALVTTVDVDGRLLALNRAAEDLIGFESREVVGARAVSFVAADEQSQVDQVLRRVARTGTTTSHESHLVGADGDLRLVAWTSAALLDADGTPTSIVSTGVDITETREAERALREAEHQEHQRLAWEASHDQLTGLVNRAGLHDHLARLGRRLASNPIAVLFTDLDGFKAINDDFGHAAGDEVLRVVSERIVAAVRTDDIVCRLGGDEFVILCPGLGFERAGALARRLEAAVAEPILFSGFPLRCRASTGVVTASGRDAATLLDRADAAMYAEKRRRRTATAPGSHQADAGPHPDEPRRIAALHRLGLLDRGPDPYVDTIVGMAAQVCGAPMAALSVVDNDRQWFTSSVGVQLTDTPRARSFCAHTILDREHVFIVDDATEDDRFATSPLVAGDAHVRFYAGAPIAVGDDPPLGSLCVMDRSPRQLSRRQIATLERLRDSLVTYLELSIVEAVPSPVRAS
ncbi:MAG TPA: diguanylate cyclase, partial [Acidimicrobiales bacterium]